MTPRHRNDLHLPAPHAARGAGEPVHVTPETAGWQFCGLDVWQLAPGASRRVRTEQREYVVVPVEGGALTVEAGHVGDWSEEDGHGAGDARFELAGRASVFDELTDYAYVGRDSVLTITAGDAAVEVALPWALARRRIEPWQLDASEVPVEVRGAGRATRQLTNFLAPGLPGPDGDGRERDADRLTCVEVLTPPGNWSSWPPHKHDVADAGSGEVELEEVYWFRIEGGADGVGAHRTYSLAEGWDTTVTIRDRDVFLVPSGYHGPCMASPDHAMWYLNVLAGPGTERSLAFSDDPMHAHVRSGWTVQALDPRVPMVLASGRVDGAGVPEPTRG